ncbi:GntR family transcriptional regulator [Streptomyces sp. NRRL S-1448]|uniref:GntR family transcriptional regulator n=1 Tax=Streptomyces sp. NRRL S-1448 TaxID=1463883 RepID=UPI003B631E5F
MIAAVDNRAGRRPALRTGETEIGVRIQIDPNSDQPIADQIASAIRRALVEGALQIGDRLPAARELAESLGVNMHTVLRGYQLLRRDGLIDLRRGRGAVVASNASEKRADLLQICRQLTVLAREMGLSSDETVELVRSCLSEGSPDSSNFRFGE